MRSARRYAAFLHKWHGLDGGRGETRTLDQTVEKLQGYIAPYSDLEDRIIPARIRGYSYGDLDLLCQSGSLVWQGHERILNGDGAIALYRPDRLPELARITEMAGGERHAELRMLLVEGALDFQSILNSLGGFPPQVLGILWDMVWTGEVSNTRLLPLQAIRAARVKRRQGRSWRNRRRMASPQNKLPIGSTGNWYLIMGPERGFASPAARTQALADQLLKRWGVVGRACLAGEGATSDWASVRHLFENLCSSQKLVKGDFVDGLGTPQYSTVEALHVLEGAPAVDRVWTLAATDPANPYGKVLPWPRYTSTGSHPQRVSGARVILYAGELIGYVGGGGHNLLTFLPSDDASLADAELALVSALTRGVRPGYPVILRSVDGQAPGRCPLAATLRQAGFLASRQAYVYRV